MIKLKNGIHLKDGIKFNSAIPYTPQDYFDTNNNTILHFYPTGRGSERPEVFVVNIPPIINGYIIDIIGAGAFENCNHIITIIILQNIHAIQQFAFYDCISLTSIIIPPSVRNIKQNVFKGCTSLTSIILPQNISDIADGLFAGCTSLTSIIIPPNVISIDNGAFEGCIKLVSITIPSNVSVGSNNLGFEIDYEYYNYQGGTYILQGTNWILQQ